MEMKYIAKNCIACIARGSIIYGTWHEGSDIDMICILPDDADLSLYGNMDEFGECHNIFLNSDDIQIDMQFILFSEFLKGLNNGNVAFLELIWQTETPFDIKYKEFHEHFDKAFIINKWNVRKWVSKQCNNSWAKCYKKLTVEVDNCMKNNESPESVSYIGRKSLWHVFRLYEYAIQILTYDKIKDYMLNNILRLYDQIVKTDNSWEVLKEKYQPLRNEYASKIRVLADKEI
ncbi:MAG: nucleotidyltransferase [Wendovervirus sonii]|uniref:Nucleotidyltransferase n=1 Tax=phage Lak_Megaphage_Sonny TaxID=3109229 RepID=A0ABZ0Z5Z3_9CAUD|nr:MAG: nucleotidyltransferase [phage Lak_Megaphage_Sonny]